MNEVTNRLTELAEKMIGVISNGVDFTVEQTPLVVQELIWRDRIYLSMLTFLLMCASLALIPGWKYIRKNGFEDDRCDMHWQSVVTVVCSIVLGSIVLAWLGTTANSLITVWCAPKLYVLEYLRAMTK